MTINCCRCDEKAGDVDNCPIHACGPKLTDAGIKEAEHFIESCKAKIKKACDEALSDIYVDMPTWIETDSWMNFRNDVRREIALTCVKEVLEPKDYWGLEVRNRIFEEHKDHFLKDAIISDLQNRIEMQKETIKQISESRSW